MEINGTGRDVRVICSLDELKEIYRALFQAMDLSTGDVDRSDVLMDIQMFLYREAMRQGVQLDKHVEWEKFLGKPDDEIRPCEIRYADYTFGGDNG
jgi:hypothetical protein